MYPFFSTKEVGAVQNSMGDLSLEPQESYHPHPSPLPEPLLSFQSPLFFVVVTWKLELAMAEPRPNRPPHFLTLAWKISDTTQTQLFPVSAQQSLPVAQNSLEATALPLMAPVIQQN